MKRTLRKPSRLSISLQRNLNAYALAASAAGVGFLALAHPAQAKIVYKAAHVPINKNGGVVDLDLNHDGIDDFKFVATSNAYARDHASPLLGSGGAGLFAAPAQASNRVDAVESNSRWLCAAALPEGVKVGVRSSPFQPGDSQLAMAHAFSSTSYGPWRHAGTAYMGLKFFIKGKAHFGWARIRVTGAGFSGIIVGYAYETIPNKSIVTGKTKGPDVITVQPASLGHLSHGASAIPAWRGNDQ
jgi:hypothetical protein